MKGEFYEVGLLTVLSPGAVGDAGWDDARRVPRLVGEWRDNARGHHSRGCDAALCRRASEVSRGPKR